MKTPDKIYLTLIVFVLLTITGFATVPIITGAVWIVLILLFIGLPLIIGDLEE